MTKIDIGCGNALKEGFVGVDRSNESQATIICDLEHPLPIEDNSVDEIFANSVLEHIHDLKGLMNELWRVGKPDCKITIVVPHWSHNGAYKDPTHCRFFDNKTFSYFEEGDKQRLYDFKPWILEYCRRVCFNNGAKMEYEENTGGESIIAIMRVKK